MDRKSPLKISLATLGCKVNQSDAAALAAGLLARGHRLVSARDRADICVVHTCTVTQKTDYQSRQLIRRAIAANPEARIIVTGCYAETAPETIREIPGVDYVCGTGQWEAVAAAAAAAGKLKRAQVLARGGEKRDCFPAGTAPFFGARTRAYLKVQDGCNAFCSYCIVPHARGANRSLPPDDALGAFRTLADQGFQEIVLTGIHLGSYGGDLHPRSSLLALLEAIERENTGIRLRLSSIEPKEFDEALVEFLAGSRNICPHLHIPLQSGDDEVLRAMNRNYSTAFYGDLVHRFVERIPELAIGLDVIGGFPGEDEAAFENTLNLIRRLPIAYLHVFPFSRRKGTAAEKLCGQIPPGTIKSRCLALRELGEEKRRLFYESFVGKEARVLLESTRDRESGLRKGYSRNYIPVLVRGGEDRVSREVPVLITEVAGRKVFGKILSHDRESGDRRAAEPQQKLTPSLPSPLEGEG
jgi:threonylcarbamoyladenosine tRNA methylthiotransferase MtaB